MELGPWWGRLTGSPSACCVRHTSADPSRAPPSLTLTPTVAGGHQVTPPAGPPALHLGRRARGSSAQQTGPRVPGFLWRCCRPPRGWRRDRQVHGSGPSPALLCSLEPSELGDAQTPQSVGLCRLQKHPVTAGLPPGRLVASVPQFPCLQSEGLDVRSPGLQDLGNGGRVPPAHLAGRIDGPEPRGTVSPPPASRARHPRALYQGSRRSTCHWQVTQLLSASCLLQGRTRRRLSPVRSAPGSRGPRARRGRRAASLPL